MTEDGGIDNRFLIANLIAYAPDTPRVVGDCDVFAIQDRVIKDILGSVQEQQAVEFAPRILDPVQQTVMTLLRGYINNPASNRNAMQNLRVPMTHTAIRDLRGADGRFQREQDIQSLIARVASTGAGFTEASRTPSKSQLPLSKNDLYLVCFDYMWS